MAVTFDQRPTVFGDRIIVTGTFESGDASIDLSSMMSSVDGCIINVSGDEALLPLGSGADPSHATGTPYCTVSGTTVTIRSGLGSDDSTYLAPANGGTFLAIGRRG